MAPLAIEQVSEHLSRSPVLDVEDCLSKARVTSVGTFFMGFATGFAVQVQCKSVLPKRFFPLAVFPTAFGLCSAMLAHQHLVKNCERHWNPRQFTVSTDEQNQLNPS